MSPAMRARICLGLACVVVSFAWLAPVQADTISNVGSWSRSDPDVTFDIVDGSRLRITVLADDLIRVRFAPDGTFVSNISGAVVKDDWPAVSFATSEDSSKVTISTAELNIEVEKTPCVVVCRDGANNLIVTDDPSRRIQWDPGYTYTRVYKTTQAGEDYLGLGWRPSGGIRRNGTRFVMKNDPGYSDPTVFYGGVPIWHGVRNGKDYAIFFDDTSWGEIDVGQESGSYMSFENLGGQVDYYFFYGPAMSKVLDRYTELTGRPFMPPKWACGYQQCRWSYTPQSEVLSIADEFRTREIPCDVIYLDVDYMDPGYQLTFNPSTFPDPAAMCSTLHGQGFHTIANIEPVLMYDSTKWNYADSHDYLLTEGGSAYMGWYDYMIYVMGAPTGSISWVDFTNPSARSWYEGEHGAFLNYGIDGIWNDKDEPDELGGTWPTTVTYDLDGNPTFHNKTSTQYCLFQTDFSYNTLKNYYSNKRPFVLSRGAYAGMQRSSAVWSGDNTSKWDHAQLNIPMGLSMSISGNPHNGHDIGGFFNDPPGSENPISSELYARWMQWGVFTAFCRQHHYGYGNYGNCPYVEPWEFGTTVEDICREFIELRYELMPYLYSLFYQAHTTGAPIHRPTVYDFPDDSGTITQDYDFMFGPFMLISPIYTAGATSRSVYLPDGPDWIDWWDDTVRTGGSTPIVSAPSERLPIHVREGAIIPMGPVMQYAGELSIDELTLRIYPGSEQTAFTLFEDDGISWAYESDGYAQTTYTALTTGEQLTLDIAARSGSYVPAERTYLLETHTWPYEDSIVYVDGEPLTEYLTKPEFDAAPSGYYYDSVADIMYARFADSGQHIEVTVGSITSPLIELSTDEIMVSGQAGGIIPESEFTVRNAGIGTLNYTITDDVDWLSVHPEQGSSEGEADTITVVYDVIGLLAGPHTGVITVADPNATNTPQTIDVQLTLDTVSPDLDLDGDVDQSDAGHLQACLTGSGGGPPSPECDDADLTNDNGVDEADMDLLLGCMSGPDVPANLDCAN